MTIQNKKDLHQKALDFSDKLSQIKILAFDVDGILTDGRISYSGEKLGWNRTFHTRDGYMMEELMKRGYKVGIITGGKGSAIYNRFSLKDNPHGEGLGLDFIFMDNNHKIDSYTQIKEKYNATDKQILYMGDDFFDLPILQLCGFSATVPETSSEIKETVDYVTQASGGQGAAREVMDLFRYANNITLSI